MFLSIITPTYNRAYTLERLFLSLTNQSDPDFEWIVVDDGSTDHTEELIRSFQKKTQIPIRYVYQENGGKQRAHNRGVREATGELSVCLDSDDALSPVAVETAKKIWNGADQKKHIGILAKRGDYDRKEPICGDWPDELKECTMIGLQEKYGFSGDTVLFFRTSLLKEHYFVEFAGEKFVPEDSLYVELDDFGTMLLSKNVLYYCEYLPDGLTHKYGDLLRRNPMGTAYCYYCRMLRSEKVSMRIKNAIISQAYLQLAGQKAEFSCDRYPVAVTIGRVFAPLYRKWKMMDKGDKT